MRLRLFPITSELLRSVGEPRSNDLIRMEWKGRIKVDLIPLRWVNQGLIPQTWENADLTRIWFLKHIHIICKHGDLIPPMMRKMRIHSRQDIGKHMGFWWDFAMAITHPRALPALSQLRWKTLGNRPALRPLLLAITGLCCDLVCLELGYTPKFKWPVFVVGNEKPLEFRWCLFYWHFPKQFANYYQQFANYYLFNVHFSQQFQCFLSEFGTGGVPASCTGLSRTWFAASMCCCLADV
jgi:hypothetical protein